MSQELREQKEALRRHIGNLGQQVPAEVRASDSARLCERLRGQARWGGCRSVLCFFPLPGEPDIRPLITEALATGKTLALPRFDPARRDYEALRVGALAELRPGHYGILEPGPESSPIESNRLDLILVPGVAYDLKGRRLGRGKGYFDRLLARIRGQRCGVAFDWQVVGEVPIGSHDVCVNWLLTPSRWIECAG